MIKVLFLCLFLFSSLIFSEDSILLYKTGFEEQEKGETKIKGWKIEFGANGNIEEGNENNKAAEGRKFLSVEAVGGGHPRPTLVSPVITIKENNEKLKIAGKTIKANLYMKSDEPISINIYLTAEGGKWNKSKEQECLLTTEWKKFEVIYKFPEEETSDCFSFQICSPYKTKGFHKFYVDEVEIYLEKK